MVDEFEKGCQPDVHLKENTQGGQVSYTAEVQQLLMQAESGTKRKKIERWISPSSSGYSLCMQENCIDV